MEIVNAATSPVASGGMGFENASAAYYAELPGSPTPRDPGDGLPALNVGPLEPTQPARIGKSGAGRSALAPVRVSLYVVTPYDDAAADKGSAANDAAVLACIAALDALGWRFVDAAQVEDEWAGRHVWRADVRADRSLPFTY